MALERTLASKQFVCSNGVYLVIDRMGAEPDVKPMDVYMTLNETICDI
jgi:hypothetical protein